MRYYGKVLGALLGWMLMRHPIGAIIGGLLGHAFDAGWLLKVRPTPRRPDAPSRERDPEAYAVLGVREDASDDAIDRAYRQLMAKYHPDRVAGAADEIRALAETRAREINSAYDRIRVLRRARH
jgi:DnaJ-domain-containing protein 1